MACTMRQPQTCITGHGHVWTRSGQTCSVGTVTARAWPPLPAVSKDFRHNQNLHIGSGEEIQADDCLHFVQRLRMSGAVPPGTRIKADDCVHFVSRSLYHVTVRTGTSSCWVLQYTRTVSVTSEDRAGVLTFACSDWENTWHISNDEKRIVTRKTNSKNNTKNCVGCVHYRVVLVVCITELCWLCAVPSCVGCVHYRVVLVVCSAELCWLCAVPSCAGCVLQRI
jgi:hypothetical protein